MKLTAFTDYSLRVLLYLAANSGRKATIAEIATAFGISEHHLVKVVHFLGKRGWIATVRGKGGGMTLAMQPKDICLGQVVRDTEGAAVPAECFEADGGHCVLSGCCGLKWRWQRPSRRSTACWSLRDVAGQGPCHRAGLHGAA